MKVKDKRRTAKVAKKEKQKKVQKTEKVSKEKKSLPIPFKKANRKFSKILSLPCYPEIEKKLFSGEKIPDIVRFIEQAEVWKSAKSAWKEKCLYEFKHWLVANKPGQVPGLARKYIDEAKASLVEKGAYIDVVAEEATLIKQQKERINRGLEAEKKLPGMGLFVSIRRESELLLKMLEQHRATQQNLGVFPSKAPEPQLPGVNVFVNQQQQVFLEKIREVKKMSPQKRYQAYRDQFVSLIGKGK